MYIYVQIAFVRIVSEFGMYTYEYEQLFLSSCVVMDRK